MFASKEKIGKMGFNYDALTSRWSKKYNWANPPLLHSNSFLIKALIEFLEGKNVVLLIPDRQFEKKKISSTI